MKQTLLAILMLFTSVSAFAQIRGTVVDAKSNESLPGATIVAKGTMTGVTTGYDGTFTINTTEGTLLQISYLGYIMQELEASQNMVVRLEPQANVLGDIVISSKVIDVAKVRE